MTKIEELEQKLNEMNEGLEVGIKKFQEQITDFNNELRIAKEDFLGELNECQKELAELKKSKKEDKWKPVEKEQYWYRDADGKIYTDFWSNHIYDEFRYKHTPIFKTEEECERYWHFMDTLKEKSYSFSREEFENHNIRKHIIYYDFERKCFDIDRSINIKYFGEIYFKTEESAQYIIDNFSKELKEYWL